MITATQTSPPSRGFSRFVRDSAVYSMGTVVGKAAALVVLPVVTRTLGPAEYGQLEVLSTVMSAVTSILVLGLDVAVTRTYPTLDEVHRRRMFGAWMAIGLLITVPFAAVVTVGRAQVSDLLFGHQTMTDEVALVGLFVVVMTIRILSLTALRNQNRASSFALITGGSLVLNAVFVVVLLDWDPSVRSVLLANVASQSLGAAGGLWLARRSVFGRPDRVIAERILRLGFPLVPAALALWAGEVLHRTILLGASSDAQVGFFGIAVRFASITVLVVIGFQTAWHPRAFAAISDGDGLAVVASDGRKILTLVAMSAVLVAIVTPEAVILVSGDAFSGASAAVGWMLVFALTFGAYQVLSIPSAIDGRLGDIGLTGTIGTAVAIGANFMLSPHYGAAGAAAAMTIGQLLAVVLIVAVNRRRVRVPFAIAPMARLMSAAAAVVLMSTLGPDGPAYRVLAGLVFLGVVVIDGSVRGLVPSVDPCHDSTASRGL
jgi:O-antigen/teichoic acid export membrane protein